MSLGMDDLLGFPASHPTGRTLSTGFLDMEETLEFNDVVVPMSFHDLLSGPEAHPASSLDTEAPFHREQSPSSAYGESMGDVKPSALTASAPFLEDEAECGTVNPSWERELELLITEFDGGVPLDEKLREELVTTSVKQFNSRTRAMKLDDKTVEYLRLQRKRVKNRLAAIRSRSRKDVLVQELQDQVDCLASENKGYKHTIRDLQSRLTSMESELRRSRVKGSLA